MTFTLHLRRIGKSLGVVLPKEALTSLKVRDGDKLYITDGADGLRITAADPEFSRQMLVGEKGLKKYRSALRKLALRKKAG
jgi:putative addiction module antidote